MNRRPQSQALFWKLTLLKSLAPHRNVQNSGARVVNAWFARIGHWALFIGYYIAGVRHSQRAPLEFIQSNLLGFGQVIEACRQQGVQRLLYASSSSVYGERSQAPFLETDRVVGVRDPNGFRPLALGRIAVGDAFHVILRQVAESTPANIVNTLNRDINKVLADPAYKKEMSDRGINLDGGTPEELAVILEKKRKVGAELAKLANLRYE